MHCANCQNPIKAGADFCPFCGAPQPHYANQPGNSPRNRAYVSNSKPDIFFMTPALRLLSRGQLFRRISAIVLFTIAAVITILGLIAWIGAWRIISDMPTEGVLGGIIFQISVVIMIYMVVHTIIIRATDINALSDSEYTIIPIASIFFKLIGEMYACFGVPLAIGGGVLVWFAGYMGNNVMGNFSLFLPGTLFREGTFLAGLLIIVVGLGLAFVVLAFFYLIAESIRIGADIARNTKATQDVLERLEGGL